MCDFMSIRIETVKTGKLIALFTGTFGTLKDMEIDFMSIMENCQVTISWELCPYKALDPTVFIVFNAKEETFTIETMITTKSGIITIHKFQMNEKDVIHFKTLQELFKSLHIPVDDRLNLII